MIRRRLIAPVALTLGFTPLALVAPPPAYAAPMSWHVKNSVNSAAQAWIYSEPDCSSAGSSHEMWPGDTAQSQGWDCARVWGHASTLKAYDDKTGALLATRNYAPNARIALGGNDYLITVN